MYNIYILQCQYVGPHMEFASPVWSTWQDYDIQALQKIQKRAVGMISGLKGENYEEKCKERRLDTPKKRRERQDLLELFKMLNEAGELDPPTLFKLKKTASAAWGCHQGHWGPTQAG